MDTPVIATSTLQIKTPHLIQGRPVETDAVLPEDGVTWSSGYGDGKLRLAVKSPFTPEAPAPNGSPQTADLHRDSSAAASPETTRTSHKIMAGVALALAGVGFVAGMAQAQPAYAQTATLATTQQQAQAARTITDNRVRDTKPVHLQSLQQVVDQFSRGNQIYVVGNPALNGSRLSERDLARYQEVLEKHPNVYVVLVERTTNLEGDDNMLSRGIGNSAEFQSVANPQTGERDGVVFMLYHNVNGDANHRKLFMRSESLPDRLGVGEENFTTESGEPKELFNMFVNAFKNEGKDIPGSLEVVMNRINGAINQHVQQTVGNATQAVTQARSALNGVEPKIRDFQQKHGTGGTLGSPDVNGWKSQLTRAEQALTGRDFQTATSLSNNVLNAVRAQEQAMANYAQAPGIAQEVRAQLEQVKSDLASLESNGAAQSARQHYDAATQKLEAFDTAYKAKDASFMDHLSGARAEAKSAADQVAESRSDATTARNVKIGAASAITLAVLATSIIMNRRAAGAGSKAEKELDEAVKEIGDRSKELMELLNMADFHQVAAYEGKTKEVADNLRKNVIEALTLVGGAEKFLAQADSLVNGKGLTRLQNWFLTRNYEKAVDLLTNPEEKLSFGLSDSSRAVMEAGSKAATWREQLLKQGETREFQKSLKEVLLAMADNRDEAKALLGEIETKSSEITGYLDKVQATAQEAKKRSEALQASATDGIFAAPAVTGNLLPMVLADEKDGGLIAKGRSLSHKNFVSAWDDFAAPAERMANDAKAIVGLGEEGRKGLVATVAGADQALQPHGVKTDWAHSQKKALSDRLNDAANKALRTGVGKDVEGVKLDTEKLGVRVTTIVAQDKERREVSPGLIKKAEDDVATARTEIAAALQQAGAFKKGTPDQVLREPKLDPTERTKSSHKNLEDVKPQLDTGNMEQAGEHLQNIKDLTQDAHRLVRETRAALKDYPATLGERQKRTDSIDASVSAKYTPSMKRIKDTYASEVMKLVAPEVGAGDTLADNIDQALANLTETRGLTKDAVANHDRAHLLTSRDQLARADGTLKSAQAHLDGITKAEQLLADKQKKVESELSALTGRVGSTRSNAGNHYVRNQARTLLGQTESKLQDAASAVKATPRNPFRADEALKVAENLRTQTESAIAADKRAFEQAQSAINSAQGSIATATAAIASAQGQSWHWSNSFGTASESVTASDLAGAYAAVATATGQLGSAQSQLSSREFESAESTARSASNTASTAVAAASAAVSSARSRFDREKRRLQDLEEADRRRKEAEARRQREAEEERRRASESSSRGGGFGGGGGSGSRGGSF